MTRLLLLWGLLAWVGATLVLSQVRWFSRAPLVDRLAPYAPGGMGRGGIVSVASFREAFGPVSRQVGERLARLVGVAEDLEVRLLRIHSPIDATGFRIRQVGYGVAGLGTAIVLVAAVRLPIVIEALLVVALPALAFLLQEQRVASASARWQRRLFLELPVVAEQLALLLSSGYSLSAAINRTAARSSGACGADLARVGLRVRQGLSEREALEEWAALADVDALRRLVPVLGLSGETSDLGRLVSEEARAIRRDVQRERIEAAERRAEQVWIPVTVAALVPGVIFLAVPFFEALRVFGS